MKHPIRTLAALVLAAVLVLSCVTVNAATTVTKIRTTSFGATLRKTPEQTDENKITLIPADTYLNVYDQVGSWYYVEYKNQYGYVTANERWTEAVAWDTNGDGIPETTSPTQTLGKSGYTPEIIEGRGGMVLGVNGTIVEGGSNVRSAMDANDYFNIVETLHGGTQVYVYFRLPTYDKTNSWYYILCPDGTEGFVFGTKLILNADG